MEYEWTLNETKPTGVVIERHARPKFGFHFSRLKINDTPKIFNGSTFRCKIIFSNLTNVTSNPSTLYIQGMFSIEDLNHYGLSVCLNALIHMHLIE